MNPHISLGMLHSRLMRFSLILTIAAAGLVMGAQPATAAPGGCPPPFPPEGWQYANSQVALGTSGEVGSEQQASAQPGGRWFTKAGLAIQNDDKVTLRVPKAQRGDVRIEWSETNASPAKVTVKRQGAVVVVKPRSDCPAEWTKLAGGFTFKGKHCLKLQVVGPGKERGTALVGLRKDCSAT